MLEIPSIKELIGLYFNSEVDRLKFNNQCLGIMQKDYEDKIATLLNTAKNQIDPIDPKELEEKYKNNIKMINEIKKIREDIEWLRVMKRSGQKGINDEIRLLDLSITTKQKMVLLEIARRQKKHDEAIAYGELVKKCDKSLLYINSIISEVNKMCPMIICDDGKYKIDDSEYKEFYEILLKHG